MQTERADSMHKLRAEEGISGHKYSVALLSKTEMGCYLWQHNDLAKKKPKHLNVVHKIHTGLWLLKTEVKLFFPIPKFVSPRFNKKSHFRYSR